MHPKLSDVVRNSLRVVCAGCIIVLAFPLVLLAESCTEAEAFNKMMALGRAQSRMMSAGNVTIDSPAVKLSQESGPLSELLAQKKYAEACKGYDKLAAKYKIDLAEESKGMVTYEELAKDGGKRGGTCSVTDVSTKMMNLHQQLEDKAALGDVSRDVFSQFGEDTKPIGELMVTNPTEACRLLDKVKVKYGLN